MNMHKNAKLTPLGPERRVNLSAAGRDDVGRTHAHQGRRFTTYIPVGVFPDQKQHSAIAHLKAALTYYRRLGVTVKRVMTDTVAEPAEAMGSAIPLTPWFGQAHQPSPPLANNSASNTSEPNPIRPGPTARPNVSLKQRAQDPPLWTHSYNWHRPHSGIKAQTPIGHLNLNQNNLLRLYMEVLLGQQYAGAWRREVGV